MAAYSQDHTFSGQNSFLTRLFLEIYTITQLRYLFKYLGPHGHLRKKRYGDLKVIKVNMKHNDQTAL